ncbi:MBL fold metallo-hydrolase [Candidatus Parcubacteria bacterium]|nr:MBL fold metallo-hydrolase [Candidatus Parcubacteria bacterium]
MRVSFHGAVREVTGSCHLLKVKDRHGVEHQYLFDCGMFQGESLCSDKNLKPFGFDASHVEAVFITHPHADHTGRLPKLVEEGFNGPICMTHPCAPLAKLVLEDAFQIMSEEAEKCGSSVLYERDDLIKTFSLVKGVGYHEEIQPAPGIHIYFHDAGHVLGSAYLSVEAEGKRLIFSGDIGNDDVPILPETEPISRATAVVCEATYGHRVHEPVSERETKLKAVLEQTIVEKGVLLIPAFSLERTQELLYAFDRILETQLHTRIPIFLDSPMAIRATELYRHFKQYLTFTTPVLASADQDFFSFQNLRETLTVEESKSINEVPPPKVIIAGSGMMSGGRIMHHLRRYLPSPTTTVLIIGYQAHGTLGRRIYEGAKQVRIFGKEVEVAAHVAAIGAFSAHGDMHKLTRWLTPEDGQIPKKIFLTHGDAEAKEVFATHLRHTLGTEVIIPTFHGEEEI